MEANSTCGRFLEALRAVSKKTVSARSWYVQLMRLQEQLRTVVYMLLSRGRNGNQGLPAAGVVMMSDDPSTFTAICFNLMQSLVLKCSCHFNPESTAGTTFVSEVLLSGAVRVTLTE